MDLAISTSIVDGRTVVGVNGEIDLATIPQLYQALADQVMNQPAATIIVDLDGVYVCDDAGLGVLLGVAGRARASGGELVVVCSEGHLRARLASTRFDRAVSVAATIADIRGSTD